MAHFAKLDENNIVIQVLVTDNNEPDEGLAWLEENFPGRWLKTSYNTFQNTHRQNGTPLRGNFASVGSIYLENEDLFMQPKPYPSWILDATNAKWVAPIQAPTEEDYWAWDEDAQAWIDSRS